MDIIQIMSNLCIISGTMLETLNNDQNKQNKFYVYIFR